MSDDTPRPSTPFDPSTMSGAGLPPTRAVWYKRPWVLVTAAVVVVIGASVLIDLPRPISNSEDVASQTSSINEINTDLTGCAFAVQETFTIYQDMKTGGLTASDRMRAPSMLRDDQTACSLTNSSIFDLTNNIQVQDTTAGKNVDRMLSVTTVWVTADALAAVEDIQSLYGNPNNAAKVADLGNQEALLAKDRAEAIADVQGAQQILGAKLPMPNLPDLPHLVGTP